MGKDAVKEIIIKELQTMEAAKFGCAKDPNYRMGKVVGMLKAFYISGMITVGERDEINEELFWS